MAIVVDGPNGERVRTELVAALPAGLEAIDAASVTAALSRQKVTSLSAALGAPRRHKATIAKLHRAARAVGADAIIAGAVPAGKEKGGLELQLVVVRISHKGAVVDETVRFARGASRAARWRSLLGDALGDLRAGAAPVAVEETKEEAKEEEEAEKPDRAAPSSTPSAAAEEHGSPEGEGKDQGSTGRNDAAAHATATDALLVAFVGLDLGGRQFHYNQRVTNDNLRPYDLPESALLPISPGAVLSAEFFPLVPYDLGFWRDLGLVGSLEYNLAKAKLGNTTLDTRWYAWEVKLRGRYHVGSASSAPTIGLEGGVGASVFTFKGAAADTDRLPGVDYEYLRFGADGRLPLGRVDLIAGAAFRHLLANGGTLDKHFPRASINGLDAKIGGALPLTRSIEARLVLSYVRFGATLHALPGDTYIAGGSLEQMLHLELGAAAFF